MLIGSLSRVREHIFLAAVVAVGLPKLRRTEISELALCNLGGGYCSDIYLALAVNDNKDKKDFGYVNTCRLVNRTRVTRYQRPKLKVYMHLRMLPLG